MTNLLANLILGHLLGDFFLQPKWMAVNKSASHWKSLQHVFLYTFCICLFTSFNWIWILIVFIPHFCIDRFSLGDKWLDLIDGRSLRDFFENGRKNIPISQYAIDGDNKRDNYHILRGGFTTIVYTVTDNGLHFFCLWYGWQFLEKIS
jgi:hypothetical protein